MVFLTHSWENFLMLEDAYKKKLKNCISEYFLIQIVNRLQTGYKLSNSLDSNDLKKLTWNTFTID